MMLSSEYLSPCMCPKVVSWWFHGGFIVCKQFANSSCLQTVCLFGLLTSRYQTRITTAARAQFGALTLASDAALILAKLAANAWPSEIERRLTVTLSLSLRRTALRTFTRLQPVSSTIAKGMVGRLPHSRTLHAQAWLVARWLRALV